MTDHILELKYKRDFAHKQWAKAETVFGYMNIRIYIIQLLLI